VDLDEKAKHDIVVPLLEMLDMLFALEVLLDEQV
jgi:hypothetical protein